MRSFEDYTDYLFHLAPLFQNVGKYAYKEGLSTTIALDQHFGHPHRHYKCIHIAGTNGKGSCSHTIASILQEAGYKVGLYTSPHLLSFRERIRVNGEPISEDYVMDFIDTEKLFLESLHPSFFEVATALAFKYFADEKVDYAVIEVGLGGRLDCTNIISPILSVITNISMDHVQLLGDTLEKIAAEKAGIMKPGVPCVIGETLPETLPVFEAKAKEVGCKLVLAEQRGNGENGENGGNGENGENYLEHFALKGLYQQKNLRTILTAVDQLDKCGVFQAHQSPINSCILRGLENVVRNTHLRGRWETLSTSPLTICDTGHNVGGMQYIAQQLSTLHPAPCTLHLIIGMVNDKDITGVLALLPKDARYYFTQASVSRALPAEELQRLAQQQGLHGDAYPTVEKAITTAQRHAGAANDIIFIGGSTFVVADALKMFNNKIY